MNFVNLTQSLAMVWNTQDKTGTEYTTALVRTKFKLQMVSDKEYELIFDDDQGELFDEDIFFEESEQVRFPSDFVPFKPYTDFILNAISYPPNEKPSTNWECGFWLSDLMGKVRLSKYLSLIGTRYYKKHPQLNTWYTDTPEAIQELPILYSNSFGGVLKDEESNEILEIYEKNPVGQGFLHHKQQTNEVLAPMIYPHNKYEECYDGFCAIHSSWLDRLQYGGTYDAKWEKEKHPLLPNDFNEMFYQSAHPEMILKEPIQNGIKINLINLHPKHASLFIYIDNYDFVVRKTTRTIVEDLPMRIDTIIIDAMHSDIENWRVYISWRSYSVVTEKATDDYIVFLNTDEQ